MVIEMGASLAELAALVAKETTIEPATPMLPARSDAPAALLRTLNMRVLIDLPSALVGCRGTSQLVLRMPWRTCWFPQRQEPGQRWVADVTGLLGEGTANSCKATMCPHANPRSAKPATPGTEQRSIDPPPEERATGGPGVVRAASPTARSYEHGTAVQDATATAIPTSSHR